MRIRCTSSGPSAMRSVRAPGVHAGERRVAGDAHGALHLDRAVDHAFVAPRARRS